LALRVQSVSKRFGGLQALKRVDLIVETGSLTALIGPNGAGKTTLLNIINGLEATDTGEIFDDGTPITRLPPHERASRGIARTFQILKGFRQLSVLENVMIGRHVRTRAGVLHGLFALPSSRAEDRESREVARDVLKFLGLEAYAERPLAELPHGLQRLAELARAIASEPRILLTDEPSSGLNPSEVDVLLQALKAIQARGVTIFLVEHNMRLVTGIATKVIVLNFGDKIAEGTPEEIHNNPAVIAAYLGRGFGALRA
jgi:branched-chain amino acid transport system ATP-binding protein